MSGEAAAAIGIFPRNERRQVSDERGLGGYGKNKPKTATRPQRQIGVSHRLNALKP
jgi:hypothetical protein